MKVMRRKTWWGIAVWLLCSITLVQADGYGSKADAQAALEKAIINRNTLEFGQAFAGLKEYASFEEIRANLANALKSFVSNQNKFTEVDKNFFNVVKDKLEYETKQHVLQIRAALQQFRACIETCGIRFRNTLPEVLDSDFNNLLESYLDIDTTKEINASTFLAAFEQESVAPLQTLLSKKEVDLDLVFTNLEKLSAIDAIYKRPALVEELKNLDESIKELLRLLFNQNRSVGLEFLGKYLTNMFYFALQRSLEEPLQKYFLDKIDALQNNDEQREKKVASYGQIAKFFQNTQAKIEKFPKSQGFLKTFYAAIYVAVLPQLQKNLKELESSSSAASSIAQTAPEELVKGKEIVVYKAPGSFEPPKESTFLEKMKGATSGSVILSPQAKVPSGEIVSGGVESVEVAKENVPVVNPEKPISIELTPAGSKIMENLKGASSRPLTLSQPKVPTEIIVPQETQTAQATPEESVKGREIVVYKAPVSFESPKEPTILEKMQNAASRPVTLTSPMVGKETKSLTVPAESVKIEKENIQIVNPERPVSIAFTPAGSKIIENITKASSAAAVIPQSKIQTTYMIDKEKQAAPEESLQGKEIVIYEPVKLSIEEQMALYPRINALEKVYEFLSFIGFDVPVLTKEEKQALNGEKIKALLNLDAIFCRASDFLAVYPIVPLEVSYQSALAFGKSSAKKPNSLVDVYQAMSEFLLTPNEKGQVGVLREDLIKSEDLNFLENAVNGIVVLAKQKLLDGESAFWNKLNQLLFTTVIKAHNDLVAKVYNDPTTSESVKNALQSQLQIINKQSPTVADFYTDTLYQALDKAIVPPGAPPIYKSKKAQIKSMLEKATSALKAQALQGSGLKNLAQQASASQVPQAQSEEALNQPTIVQPFTQGTNTFDKVKTCIAKIRMPFFVYSDEKLMYEDFGESNKEAVKQKIERLIDPREETFDLKKFLELSGIEFLNKGGLFSKATPKMLGAFHQAFINEWYFPFIKESLADTYAQEAYEAFKALSTLSVFPVDLKEQEYFTTIADVVVEKVSAAYNAQFLSLFEKPNKNIAEKAYYDLANVMISMEKDPTKGQRVWKILQPQYMKIKDKIVAQGMGRALVLDSDLSQEAQKNREQNTDIRIEELKKIEALQKTRAATQDDIDFLKKNISVFGDLASLFKFTLPVFSEHIARIAGESLPELQKHIYTLITSLDVDDIPGFMYNLNSIEGLENQLPDIKQGFLESNQHPSEPSMIVEVVEKFLKNGGITKIGNSFNRSKIEDAQALFEELKNKNLLASEMLWKDYIAFFNKRLMKHFIISYIKYAHTWLGQEKDPKKVAAFTESLKLVHEKMNALLQDVSNGLSSQASLPLELAYKEIDTDIRKGEVPSVAWAADGALRTILELMDLYGLIPAALPADAEKNPDNVRRLLMPAGAAKEFDQEPVLRLYVVNGAAMTLQEWVWALNTNGGYYKPRPLAAVYNMMLEWLQGGVEANLALDAKDASVQQRARLFEDKLKGVREGLQSLVDQKLVSPRFAQFYFKTNMSYWFFVSVLQKHSALCTAYCATHPDDVAFAQLLQEDTAKIKAVFEKKENLPETLQNMPRTLKEVLTSNYTAFDASLTQIIDAQTAAYQAAENQRTPNAATDRERILGTWVIEVQSLGKRLGYIYPEIDYSNLLGATFSDMEALVTPQNYEAEQIDGFVQHMTLFYGLLRITEERSWTEVLTRATMRPRLPQEVFVSLKNWLVPLGSEIESGVLRNPFGSDVIAHARSAFNDLKKENKLPSILDEAIYFGTMSKKSAQRYLAGYLKRCAEWLKGNPDDTNFAQQVFAQIIALKKDLSFSGEVREVLEPIYDNFIATLGAKYELYVDAKTLASSKSKNASYQKERDLLARSEIAKAQELSAQAQSLKKEPQQTALTPETHATAEALALVRSGLEKLGIMFNDPITPGYIDRAWGLAGWDPQTLDIEKRLRGGSDYFTVIMTLLAFKGVSFTKIALEKELKISPARRAELAQSDKNEAIFRDWGTWHAVKQALEQIFKGATPRDGYINDLKNALYKALEITSPPRNVVGQAAKIEISEQKKLEEKARQTSAGINEGVDLLKLGYALKAFLVQEITAQKIKTALASPNKKAAIGTLCSLKNSFSEDDLKKFLGMVKLPSTLSVEQLFEVTVGTTRKKLDDLRSLLSALMGRGLLDATYPEKLLNLIQKPLGDLVRQHLEGLVNAKLDIAASRSLLNALKKVQGKDQDLIGDVVSAFVEKVQQKITPAIMQLVQSARAPFEQKGISFTNNLSTLSDVIGKGSGSVAQFFDIQVHNSRSELALHAKTENSAGTALTFYTTVLKNMISGFPQKASGEGMTALTTLRSLEYIGADDIKSLEKAAALEAIKGALAAHLEDVLHSKASKSLEADVNRIREDSVYKNFADKGALDPLYESALAELKGGKEGGIGVVSGEMTGSSAQGSSQTASTSSTRIKTASEQKYDAALQEKKRLALKTQATRALTLLMGVRDALLSLGFELEKPSLDAIVADVTPWIAWKKGTGNALKMLAFATPALSFEEKGKLRSADEMIKYAISWGSVVTSREDRVKQFLKLWNANKDEKINNALYELKDTGFIPGSVLEYLYGLVDAMLEVVVKEHVERLKAALVKQNTDKLRAEELYNNFIKDLKSANNFVATSTLAVLTVGLGTRKVIQGMYTDAIVFFTAALKTLTNEKKTPSISPITGASLIPEQKAAPAPLVTPPNEPREEGVGQKPPPEQQGGAWNAIKNFVGSLFS